MGYTHYFEGVIPTAEIVADALAIVAASDVSIKGWDGTGEPTIELGNISLNGDESLDQDYESFVLDNGLWSFCKTSRVRPYDKVVTAILISSLVHNVGSFSSDGDLKDWEPGIALFERAVRPLTEDEKDFLAARLQ